MARPVEWRLRSARGDRAFPARLAHRPSRRSHRATSHGGKETGHSARTTGRLNPDRCRRQKLAPFRNPQAMTRTSSRERVAPLPRRKRILCGKSPHRAPRPPGKPSKSGSQWTLRWCGESAANSSLESPGGPTFGILFPPHARVRARGQRREPRYCRADLPRARLRVEIPEPSGWFYAKAAYRSAGPAQSRAGLPVSSHPLRQPCAVRRFLGLAEHQRFVLDMISIAR